MIDAIFDAGFASTAQLYRDSQAVLGMTPRQYRKGARRNRSALVWPNAAWGPSW